MDCPKCTEELVVKQSKAAVSVAGIVSVPVFLIGALLLLANPAIGLLVIVVALLIGMAGRGTVTKMVCPDCGYSKRI